MTDEIKPDSLQTPGGSVSSPQTVTAVPAAPPQMPAPAVAANPPMPAQASQQTTQPSVPPVSPAEPVASVPPVPPLVQPEVNVEPPVIPVAPVVPAPPQSVPPVDQVPAKEPVSAPEPVSVPAPTPAMQEAPISQEALLQDLKKKMDEKKAEREMVVGLKNKKASQQEPETIVNQQSDIPLAKQSGKQKKKKGGCLLMVLVLLLAGAGSGYYFRDQLKEPFNQIKDQITELLGSKSSEQPEEKTEENQDSTPLANQEIPELPVSDAIVEPVSSPVSVPLISKPAYMYFGRVNQTGTDFLAVEADYQTTDDVCDLLADYLEYDLRSDLVEEGWSSGLPDAEEISLYSLSNQDIDGDEPLSILACELSKDQILDLHFSSQLRAYGGGSTRVGLIQEVLDLMARQFGASSTYITIEGVEDDGTGSLQP